MTRMFAEALVIRNLVLQGVIVVYYNFNVIIELSGNKTIVVRTKRVQYLLPVAFTIRTTANCLEDFSLHWKTTPKTTRKTNMILS